MANSLISKMFRPPLFTQLVSCRVLLYFVLVFRSVSLRLSRGTLPFSVQAYLRASSVFWGKQGTVAGTRRFSNEPPEKISRYPIPYKKDLPYDIVELMEEVESKVIKRKRIIRHQKHPLILH